MQKVAPFQCNGYRNMACKCLIVMSLYISKLIAFGTKAAIDRVLRISLAPDGLAFAISLGLTTGQQAEPGRAHEPYPLPNPVAGYFFVAQTFTRGAGTLSTWSRDIL